MPSDACASSARGPNPGLTSRRQSGLQLVHRRRSGSERFSTDQQRFSLFYPIVIGIIPKRTRILSHNRPEKARGCRKFPEFLHGSRGLSPTFDLVARGACPHTLQGDVRIHHMRSVRVIPSQKSLIRRPIRKYNTYYARYFLKRRTHNRIQKSFRLALQA